MLTNVEGHETTGEEIAVKLMVLLTMALELDFGEARKVKRGFSRKSNFLKSQMSETLKD